MSVTCLIAVMDERPGDAAAAAVAADLDASCRLPAATADGLPQLVVGTLDVNQGARRLGGLAFLLPAQRVQGAPMCNLAFSALSEVGL